MKLLGVVADEEIQDLLQGSQGLYLASALFIWCY
jgi:hypothetical protein